MKAKKLFIFSSMLIGAGLLATASMSTIPNTSVVNQIQKQEEVTTPPKPDPINAREMAKNKEFIDRNIPIAIEEIVGRIVAILSTEINKIENNEELEVEKKIAGQFYYSKLQAFLQDNLTNIKSDPQKYGFTIVYPLLFAENLQLNIGALDYNNNKLEGFSWGNTENSSYDKVLPKESKTANLNYLNTLDAEKYEALWKNYKSDLDKEALRLLFNEEDQPKFGTQFTLERKIVDGQTVFIGSDPKNIEGITTWDDYIISKIKPRFLDFDIQQNLKNQNREDTPPIIIPIEEKVDFTAPDTPGIEITSDFEIRDIPSLAPYSHHSYSNLSPTEFVTKYNSLDQVNKDSALFFDNPINKRFSNKVNSVILDDQNRASVNITLTDNLLKSNSRDYRAIVPNLSSITPDLLTVYRFNSYRIILSEFNKIQNSFTVNDNFDLSKIEGFSTKGIAKIYNSLFGLTKMIFSESYLKAKEDLIVKYSKLAYTNENIRSFGNELRTLFYKYIQNSTINDESFIGYISSINGDKIDTVNNFVKNLNEESIAKIQALGIDLNSLQQALTYLNLQATLIKEITYSPNQDPEDPFQKYLQYSINTNVVSKPILELIDLLKKESTDQAAVTKIQDSLDKNNAVLSQDTNTVAIAASAAVGAAALTLLSAIGLGIILKRKK
ncbi:hypothetical protein EI74_0820 [Mycoplasma testudineum]|uniref:Lipoprotein-associated protein n=1 Tax=Mycoplasma testudineum TaxID=244584 RepID=A0A4R6IBQ1_9MOLU|nr:hypothetical protein [Mycoplasma testudineum]OYD26514.1 hypothetical protein CG473_03675 [Mycoplasma testudineum]TDO19001.1 hypothetical protein EI74_0820 [Mycoplasma testudineum]